MKQDPSDWREALRARLATWRQTRPRRLTLLAQGALVFERFARAIAPALIVTGFFVALSWTGLWLGAPTWLRILGVSAFIGALVAALTRLRTFSWPSAGQARDALDAGDSDAPAAALADALANSGDPRTQGLWRLHQLRAERLAAKLRPVVPSPRLWTVDRYALGALAVLAFAPRACSRGRKNTPASPPPSIGAGAPADGAPSRIDAWIDPPAYTGKPPIVLSPVRRAGGRNYRSGRLHHCRPRRQCRRAARRNPGRHRSRSGRGKSRGGCERAALHPARRRPPEHFPRVRRNRAFCLARHPRPSAADHAAGCAADQSPRFVRARLSDRGRLRRARRAGRRQALGRRTGARRASAGPAAERLARPSVGPGRAWRGQDDARLERQPLCRRAGRSLVARP